MRIPSLNSKRIIFCVIFKKIFILIGKNLHAKITDIDQVDYHFKFFVASYHIVVKRPEVSCSQQFVLIFYRNEYKNSGIYFIRSLLVWFSDTFSGHAQKMARKNKSFVAFFFRRSDIGKDFPIGENFSKNSAHTGIIIIALFIWKNKICFNGKPFSVFCRTSAVISVCMCKILYDRINLYITDQIQIWIFINDGYFVYQLLQGITPCFFVLKLGNNLPVHKGCKFQFGFFFCYMR